jgi:hypothetical protein
VLEAVSEQNRYMLRHAVLIAVLFISIAHLRAVDPRVQLGETQERTVKTAGAVKTTAALFRSDRVSRKPSGHGYSETLPRLTYTR